MSRIFAFIAFCALAPVLLGQQPSEPIQTGKPHKSELKKGAKNAHTVVLDEGKEYLIDMTSKDFDAVLHLFNVEGKQLAANDDGGAGKNARLGFVAQKGGTHKVVATSFGGLGAGAYEVTVAPITKAGEPQVKKGKLEGKSDKPGVLQPHEQFKVELEQNKVFRIELESAAFVPVLHVYKHKGKFLAGDQGNAHKKATLYFIPAETGPYELRVLAQLKAPLAKGELAPAGEFALTIQPYEFVKK